MIYVISKSTFGDYNVRDIQCNANWDCCPYSDYARIPDDLVEGILATKGYCDIVLNDEGAEVVSFTANEIPDVPGECCGLNTVLSVNGINANANGELHLEHSDIGAAPTGYGLGENTKESRDANLLPGTGFYHCDQNTPDAEWWYGLHTKHTDGYAHQRMRKTYRECVAERFQIGGVWQQWAYVNPPMGVGVEYRTTEKWQGKTVWTVLIDCGSVPEGNNTASTNFAASGCLSCRASVGGRALPMVALDASASNQTNISPYFCTATALADLGKICITTSASGSFVTEYANKPLYAQVWYTKD